MIISRLLEKSISQAKKSILLLGPRQVGKSTLLSGLKPDLSINLASPAEYLAMSTNPSELEERVERDNPNVVFIDEIQRIPDILNAIQVLVDERRPKIKFLLSGSSARKLKRGSANLLPGRLFTYRMGPISCAELDFKMDTSRALETGCLPEPYLMDRSAAEKLLRSYAATYIQEEILQETLIRQVQGFSRFFAVACTTAGQFFDFSKVARQAKVSRSAARRYFEILEDTLLCERLSAYEDQTLDLVLHPRFYLFDVGIVNASLGNFTASADRKGLLLEHLFYNQIKNTAYALDVEPRLSHFRTRGGLEIDFIVELKNEVYAVEVKSSNPTEDDLGALKQFQRLTKRKAKCLVAYHGKTERRVAGIEILPWQNAIREIFKI